MLGPQPRFHNWQRVLVQWIQVTKSAKQRKINRSYPSEIISCNLDGTYDVQFACDHSIEHEVKSERILESFPHVNRTEVHLIPANTKIRVLWPADRVYYIATIMEHMEDGTTRIEYEDLTDEPLSEEATNDDPEHMKYEIIDLKNERIQLYKWKKNKLNHEKKVRTPKRKVPSALKRKVSCQSCANCIKSDCEVCKYCLDKTKFGGLNKMKQKCAERRCLNPRLPPASSSSSSSASSSIPTVTDNKDDDNDINVQEPPKKRLKLIAKKDTNKLQELSKKIAVHNLKITKEETKLRKLIAKQKEQTSLVSSLRNEFLVMKKMQVEALNREIGISSESCSSSSSSSSSSTDISQDFGQPPPYEGEELTMQDSEDENQVIDESEWL